MSEGAPTRPASPASVAASLPAPELSSIPSNALNPNASSTSVNIAHEAAIPIDLPDHAHAQGHQALEITLPNANGDGEQFELQPVGKHEKVRGTVVKDKKTGRHYKKVYKRKEVGYSLGRAKGAPTIKVLPRKGAPIGLGHAIPSNEYRPPVDPSHHHHGHHRNGGRHSQESLPNSPVGMGQAEKQQLFQEIRNVIRAEMKANGGQDKTIIVNASGSKGKELAKNLKAQGAPVHHSGEGTPAGEQNKEPKDYEIPGEGTPAQGSGKEDILDEKKELNKSSSQDTKAENNLTKQIDDDDASVTTRASNALSRVSSESSCSSWDSGDEDGISFPNPWAKLRYHLKEEMAEALGVFVFLTFGCAVDCQVFLAQALSPAAEKGDYLSVAFGWGIGVGMGVWTCGGKSGGHLNPAVTLALAIFRGFPWRKVPRYWIAQLFGAWFAALCVYGCYINPLRMVDPAKTSKTGSYFTTYPAEFLLPQGARISGWFNEVYGTAILLVIILAIGDSDNVAPVDGMAPLVLLWVITGIGSTFGYQTAFALNPARDLGPRLMLWTVGYGTDVWTYDAGYFSWTPLLGSLVGATLGAFLYDACIYTGTESPLNRVWNWSQIPLVGKYLKSKSGKESEEEFSDDAKSVQKLKPTAA